MVIVWTESLKVSAVANVVSTIVGIPGTWLALLMVELLYELSSMFSPMTEPFSG
jgi:hypothetical protein